MFYVTSKIGASILGISPVQKLLRLDDIPQTSGATFVEAEHGGPQPMNPSPKPLNPKPLNPKP